MYERPPLNLLAFLALGSAPPQVLLTGHDAPHSREVQFADGARAAHPSMFIRLSTRSKGPVAQATLLTTTDVAMRTKYVDDVSIRCPAYGFRADQ